MFRLEEFTEVLFRGRETVPEEVDLLRDLIPHAKQLYRNPGWRRPIFAAAATAAR